MAPSLRVSVSDIRRRLGTRREISRRIPVTDVSGLGGVAGTVVAPDGELDLDLVLESVPEGVMVAGTVVAPWSAECRRCLGPVTGDVEVHIHELFEHDPTPGDTYALDDETVDLEPMLRDSVLLSLPLSVLCRDDCPGPDPERFPTTVEDDRADDQHVGDGPGDASGDTPPGDPRWAALGELRFDE